MMEVACEKEKTCGRLLGEEFAKQTPNCRHCGIIDHGCECSAAVVLVLEASVFLLSYVNVFLVG